MLHVNIRLALENSIVNFRINTPISLTSSSMDAKFDPYEINLVTLRPKEVK